MRKRGVELEIRATGDCAVNALPVETRQVLLNLVRNACEATNRRGAKVTMIMTGKPDAVEVVVADEGTGIEPAMLPNLFQFGASTKGENGNGMGLWVVKQLVKSTAERSTWNRRPARAPALPSFGRAKFRRRRGLRQPLPLAVRTLMPGRPQRNLRQRAIEMHVPAIDDEVLPGGVPGLGGRQQKHRRRRDLRRQRHALPQRNLVGDLLEALLPDRPACRASADREASSPQPAAPR